ncbi:MAG: chalcone isomerase family protein [Halomonas sp.]
MRRLTLLCLLLLLALPAVAEERVTVNGARFATELEVDGQPYRLIGHGLLRYMVWDAYAGAYYQAPEARDPEPDAEIPRRLELEYFHAIEAEEFASVTREEVRKARDEADYQKLLPGLDDFTDAYRSVEPGDRYALTWDDEGLRLALNGETLFEGDDPALAEALFAIWLGEAPLKAGFRDALLGRR